MFGNVNVATTRWKHWEFGLQADKTGLAAVWLPNQWTDHQRDQVMVDRRFWASYLAQFSAYWSGDLRQWTLPWHVSGTAFQQAVWKALTDIPYGSVVTYQELARAIGRPAAVRAVAAAVGKNPLPIVLPCHRVIGSNNTLTGYGGGLVLKQQLLELEGVARRLKPTGHARFSF
jgi:O-6-methylguanine DNA methyltransferase